MEEVREFVNAELVDLGIEPLSPLRMEMLIASVNSPLPADYTPHQASILANTMLAKQILKLLSKSDVTEGGYSVKWNRDGVLSYYKILCADLGISDGLTPEKPTLTDRSNAW